jgi:hypothetical protein
MWKPKQRAFFMGWLLSRFKKVTTCGLFLLVFSFLFLRLSLLVFSVGTSAHAPYGSTTLSLYKKKLDYVEGNGVH